MANTTNFGWETPDDTDLVKDGAAAMRTLGNSIDASFVDLKGGTSGQVLSKNSNTDLDFVWVAQDDSNAIQNAIVDAKGDLITATAADTPARLAVGTNGHVLTADSTTATGLKWAAAAAGGKVLQVVQATYGTFTRNSTSTYADTGLSGSITPSATSSKILVIMYQLLGKTANDATNRVAIKLLRGATQIYEATDIARTDYAGETVQGYTLVTLDSPATTSATTYKTQFKNMVNGAAADLFNSANGPATLILAEIGA